MIWDLQMVLDKLTAGFGTAAAEEARRLHEGALRPSSQVQVRWGKGNVVGNFSFTYLLGGERRTLAFVETNGKLTTLDYGGLLSHPAFAHGAERDELTGRFGRLPGVAQQLAAGRKSLWITLSELDERAVDEFWNIVDWGLARMRESPGADGATAPESGAPL